MKLDLALQLYSIRNETAKDFFGALEKWQKWAIPVLNLQATVTLRPKI